MTNGYLLIILATIAIFLIYATLRGWISWRGGKGIATLTAFHDFQAKDKQEAIEYVIEESSGNKMEDQKNGAGNNDLIKELVKKAVYNN